MTHYQPFDAEYRAAGVAGGASMTRREVITKAIVKRLNWIQAAEIIRI